jgi:CRISPR-associated protein Cmr2
MSEYTAASFAPVQGFIEKSRKLRDLYGSSLILSFLSFKLVQKAECLGLTVISPGLPNVAKGMPNRILVRGKFDRNLVQNTLLKEWQTILKICRVWIEDNLGIPKNQYCWSQTQGKTGQSKGEWERWESYTWEVFWGYGDSVQAAMDDLETRKLRRDWIAINWVGSSSSLTGTDAIAWHQLGKLDSNPGRLLSQSEQEEMELFYRRLSWLLDNPDERVGQPSLSLEELRKKQSPPDQNRQYFEQIGRYVAPNERLSIPELVKRLVTYDVIADHIGIDRLKAKDDDPEFKDIIREPGYWTAWFMGDGDKVGDKLKVLASRHDHDPQQRDKELKHFTDLIREWGQEFQRKPDLFPQGKGRVIYAGGDDFLGVLYSNETQSSETPEKLKPIEALQWLLALESHWENQQQQIKQDLNLDFTYSVGFVWAGHQVPQRDILQHCRDAEKRAKNQGRDRVTIRVVFNSGQSVQWTCPWDYLHVLTNYRDRDGKTWSQEPNWGHIYSDWAQLKARHAIPLNDKFGNADDSIALAIFDLYFRDRSPRTDKKKPINKDYLIDSDNSKHIIGQDALEADFIQWIDGLINIGWQLCSNS